MSTRTSGIVAAIFAVVLVGLGIFTLVTTGSLRSEVTDLEAKADSLEAQAADLKKSSGEQNGIGVKDVAAKVRKIEECLPELQTEINSMDLEAFGEEFFVVTNSQVSSYCSPLVYPSSSPRGE